MKTSEVTLYVIGLTKEEAAETALYDYLEAAQEAADDSEDDLKVFNVTATVDWSTIASEFL